MSSETFPSAFSADIQRAYKAGLFTDLMIICGKEEFKVHKIIVCSQSPVFKATCSNGFRESLTNTIDLTADGVSLVSRMIHCLYYGTYEGFFKKHDADDWKSAYQLHAAMYALGDKYDLSVLKDTALAKFKKLATKSQPATRSKIEAQDLLELIDSISLVYSSTPDSDRQLRDVALEKFKAVPSRFLLVDLRESFQKMVLEVPDFSWDLHQYFMNIAPEPTGSAKRKR